MARMNSRFLGGMANFFKSIWIYADISVLIFSHICARLATERSEDAFAKKTEMSAGRILAG